jgi:hypothetical protein
MGPGFHGVAKHAWGRGFHGVAAFHEVLVTMRPGTSAQVSKVDPDYEIATAAVHSGRTARQGREPR